MKILNVAIINPDTKAPVSLEEWKKDANPTRAEWVLIETDELKPFCLAKKKENGGKDVDFNTALKLGNTMTRAQGLAIYDAKYSGLDEAMELIGGDYVGGWTWTCEADADPQCNASSAWRVNLDTGYVYDNAKTLGHQVRLVSAFPLE